MFATTEEMQEPVGAPKTCIYKVFLNEDIVKLKHNSKQSIISCTVNLVRLHKLRSFDNRSKIRILTSLIGTDVNKLTTSSDTIQSNRIKFYKRDFINELRRIFHTESQINNRRLDS